MELGKLGIWFFFDGMTAPQSAEFAQKVEQLGYRTMWIPEAVGREPFAHAAYLLAKTEKLNIATGIANIWGRDAITMNAASKTLAELSGGRFLLGIGVSHKPIVSNLRGHSYDKPYSYMKEYLPKMKTALYRAPQPKEPVPIVIAALHPKMLALAAAETNGTHTYFVPPEHTAKVRQQIGPKPWVLVEQAICLERDATKARAVAREYMKTYTPRLPNYTNNLKNLDGRTRSSRTDAATLWLTRSSRGEARTKSATGSSSTSRPARPRYACSRCRGTIPICPIRRRLKRSLRVEKDPFSQAERTPAGVAISGASSATIGAPETFPEPVEMMFSSKCRALTLGLSVAITVAMAGCASQQQQQADTAEAAAEHAQQSAARAEAAANKAMESSQAATEAANRAAEAVKEATRKLDEASAQLEEMAKQREQRQHAAHRRRRRKPAQPKAAAESAPSTSSDTASASSSPAAAPSPAAK